MSAEDLNDLASALGQFRPLSAVKRDQLMFEAGRASAPTGWRWPLATAASSLLALCLGLVVVLRPTPEPIVRTLIVRVQVPGPEAPPTPPQPSPEPPEQGSSVREGNYPDMPYYRLQEQLSRWGLDAVPPSARPEQLLKPMTVDALLKSFDEENAFPN